MCIGCTVELELFQILFRLHEHGHDLVLHTAVMSANMIINHLYKHSFRGIMSQDNTQRYEDLIF